MAVVTMTENYALITFYDLLERIISIIELTKKELEAIGLCQNTMPGFAV